MFEKILYDELPEKNSENVLVIATTEELAKKCKEKNIAVIGLETEEKIWSAPYVVESREVIDEDFLKLLYARHNKKAYSPFETERLIAVEIDMETREETYEFLKGLDSNKALDKGFIEKEEYLQTYIENQYQFYGFGMYRLIDKQTGELVGMTSLNIERGEVFTMGYAIREDRRRQGLAYEACQGTLNFAKELGYDQVFLRISKSNEASVALAKKLGFEILNEDFAGEGLVCIFYKNFI